MSHTKSHIAFFVHCMEVNEARYIEQAKDLARVGKLTTFYREKVKMAFEINGDKLNSRIYDFDHALCSSEVQYGFSSDEEGYTEGMVFLFAKLEAQAREIYNQEIRSGKNPN